MIPAFTEQAVMIGARQSLVGVVTQPLPPARLIGAPFVIILNAGIIHRVGPNRLHVSVARSLASAGFEALRFDLSGLGDSEPRDDCLSTLDAALADIRDVTDWLQATRQVGRIVLIGLCSGADHSVAFAASDTRVAGLVLLDPAMPRTVGYFLRHYGRRLLRLRSWMNFLYGWVADWRKRGWSPRLQLKHPRDDDRGPHIDDPEVRAYLRSVYGRALANGVQFFALLTGGAEGRQNYRRQFLDAYPELSFGDQLTLEYRKDFDHTFSSESSRAALMAMVVRWMCRTHFDAAGRAADSDSNALAGDSPRGEGIPV